MELLSISSSLKNTKLITLNIRWLAYFFWVCTGLAIIHAVYVVTDMWNEPDFSRSLGVIVGLRDLGIASVLWAFGILIWRAFRKQ